MLITNAFYEKRYTIFTNQLKILINQKYNTVDIQFDKFFEIYQMIFDKSNIFFVICSIYMPRCYNLITYFISKTNSFLSQNNVKENIYESKKEILQSYLDKLLIFI